MNIGQALLMALQLSQAATTIIAQVQKAQEMNSEEVDLNFDLSLDDLAAEINKQKAEGGNSD